jgi:hypothetical protein
MCLEMALWIVSHRGLDFGANLRFRPQYQPGISGSIPGERPPDFPNFARHNYPAFLRPVAAGFLASSLPLPDPAIGSSISR